MQIMNKKIIGSYYIPTSACKVAINNNIITMLDKLQGNFAVVKDVCACGFCKLAISGIKGVNKARAVSLYQLPLLGD